MKTNCQCQCGTIQRVDAPKKSIPKEEGMVILGVIIFFSLLALIWFFKTFSTDDVDYG